MKRIVLIIVWVVLVALVAMPVSGHVLSPESEQSVQQDIPSFDDRFEYDLNVIYPSISWDLTTWIKLQLPLRYTSSPALRFGPWNRYTYCQNNPIMYTDPTGRARSPADPYGFGGDQPMQDLGIPYHQVAWPKQLDSPLAISTQNRKALENFSLIDDRGLETFGRWCEGTEDDLLLLDANYWADYMMDNQLLRNQVVPKLIHDAKSRTTSGSVQMNFQAFIEDSYFSGYGHLHATEEEAGHFVISGDAIVSTNKAGNKEVSYTLNYAWNDRIDPDLTSDDRFWAPFFSLLCPNAKDYRVNVTWDAGCEITFNENKINESTGYPF